MKSLLLFHILWTSLVNHAASYWDPDRKLVEDPEYSNPNCDTYCRLMPDYMNWREDMDYRERQGIDRVIRPTKWGAVEGLSVPGVHDTSSFVSIFLGIPYAQQHVKEEKARLRFKPAQPLPNGWEGTYDATYYRPACPQLDEWIQQDIPKFSYTNEDCLYINVFQPNRTNDQNQLNKYRVLVFIHGGQYKQGSALQYPGIILAQRDMVVVTFNYRLGPLGFLSTGDDMIPGNMGLSDQAMALRWVRENIHNFQGEPDKITLVGHEAGAACVGIHLISPITRNLFQSAIMMSGSDLSSWAVIEGTQHPQEYASRLAKIVGCDEVPGEGMVNCLKSKEPMDLVSAAEKVSRNPGETAGPFAPVVDNWGGELRWLRDSPSKLRQNPDNVMKVNTMAGFAKDDGAWILNKNFSHVFANIQTGVDAAEFKTVIKNVTRRRGARDDDQVADAIEFLYTWWVNPDNSTARRKMLIDVFTDELYASGVDMVMKSTVRALQGTNKAYMYKFDYRSERDDPETYWMGSYHNYDVQFLFGWPYLAANITYQKLSSIKLDKQYSELDRNISNGTMRMWKDFAINGDPTYYILNPAMPWNFRNLTWYPMNISNLTYFELDYNSTNEKEYHQSQLAFWQDYIFDILNLEEYTTTERYITTYKYEQYLIATYSLSALLLLALIALILVSIALMRLRGRANPKSGYY